MSTKKINFTQGTAFEIVNGERKQVLSIPAMDECNCHIDCCLKAIVLEDHGDGSTKYLYVLNGALSVGTLAQLKADSTIL